MTTRAWEGREGRSGDQRSGCAGSHRVSQLEGWGFSRMVEVSEDVSQDGIVPETLWKNRVIT